MSHVWSLISVCRFVLFWLFVCGFCCLGFFWRGVVCVGFRLVVVIICAVLVLVFFKQDELNSPEL